jgi:hypothetical protein
VHIYDELTDFLSTCDLFRNALLNFGEHWAYKNKRSTTLTRTAHRVVLSRSLAPLCNTHISAREQEEVFEINATSSTTKSRVRESNEAASWSECAARKVNYFARW